MGVLTMVLSCLLALPVAAGLKLQRRVVSGAFLAGPRSASARASQAASLLEQRARQAGNSELEALALRVGSVASSESGGGPQNLEGVKDLIRNMLVKAQEAHTNDIGLHEFCTSESAHAKESVTTYGDRSEKAQADLDKLSAESDQTTQHVADLHAEIADLQKALVNSSADRERNHTAYLQRKAELENEESKQRDAATKVSEDDAGARAKLELAAEDALKRRIKMETEEAAENLNFERKQRERKEQVHLNGEKIKHEHYSLVRMQKDLVDNKQDFKALEEQLSAAKTYQQQIAHKCTVPPVSHEQRAQHRQQQIDSLKDAYEILSA